MNFEAKDYLPKENFKFLSLVQNEEHILCDLETPERSPPPRLYTPNEVKPAYNIQINDTVKEEKPSLIALQADIKNEILETQLEEELLPKEIFEIKERGPHPPSVKEEYSELDLMLNTDQALKRRDEEERSNSSIQYGSLRNFDSQQRLMVSCAQIAPYGNIENCETISVQQTSKNDKQINCSNKINKQTSLLQLGVCDSSNNLEGSNKDHSSNCECLTCKIRNKLSRLAIVNLQKLPDCEICKKSVFDCRANLQTHRIRQHNSKDENFICNDCSASYPNKRLLSMHIRSHHLPPELNCSLSSNSFTTKRKLAQHLHAEQPYCEICKKSYKSYKSLKQHVDQVHSNVKKYVCYVCCKGYCSWDGLAYHTQTNHTTSLHKYKCKKCYRSFPDKTALEKHLKRSHLHVKSNKIVNNNTACDVCQKVFDCKAKMEIHRIRQHNSKNEYFICNDCSASYPNKRLLSMHIKNHHLPPELNCSLCSKFFTTKQKLEQHLRTEHGIDNRKTFVCETCGKTTKNKMALEAHILIHTDAKQYVCEECGKSFRTPSNLSQHIVIHSDFRPFSCDLCGKSFRIRHHLKQHMATHGMNSTPNYGKIARSKRNNKCDQENSSDGSSN